jgi:hypothetical protein
VQHLVRAIRGRFSNRSTTLRDTIDPVRRFERDFSEWGARIASLLEERAEDAAHGLFRFAREILEPGWSGFPSRAADAVADRLGWGRAGSSTGNAPARGDPQTRASQGA